VAREFHRCLYQEVEEFGGIIALPKQEIGPGMGWIAAFKDTEGNIMGLHENPKEPARKGQNRRQKTKEVRFFKSSSASSTTVGMTCGRNEKEWGLRRRFLQ